MSTLYWIQAGTRDIHFPDVNQALKDPDGLLAIGGDLSPQRLLTAYRSGIFPWYSHGQPILWWSPDPRSVLYPDKIRISRSLKKTLRKKPFTITLNTAFAEVIRACANAPREGQAGTWITEEMMEAYRELHRLGHAHSVEAWQDRKLVGGLYGVCIGQVFFGESMFSRVTDASKVAFAEFVFFLQKLDFRLIDCQVRTQHLESLGAQPMLRSSFIEALHAYCDHACALDVGPRVLVTEQDSSISSSIQG